MDAPQLVEREQLVDELTRSLRRAATEGGRLVLLSGPAGIGKTAVVHAVRSRAPAGVRQLIGHCEALTTPQALGPLLDMSERSTRLAAAVHGPRHELFAAVMRELSTTQSLMVLEDVHWADAATADLLVHVARRITQSRSLALVTYRDEDLDPEHPVRVALDGMATLPGLARRYLEPLSVVGVTALAGDRRIDVGQLHRRTGGNPFFVTEVLAAPGWAVPPTVADAVRARSRRLPPSARAVLAAMAVEAGSAQLDELLALGHPAAAVDAAIVSGMLVHVDGRVGFRHELARLGILGDLAPATRLEHHRSWLHLLQGRSGERGERGDAARVAAHAVGAGDRPATVLWSRRAAEIAAAHGTHREAAAHLEAADAASDGLDPAEHADLLAALARALGLVDRRADAVRVREQELAVRRSIGQRAGAVVAQADLAKAVWNLGDGARARRELEAATEGAEALMSAEPGPAAARAAAHVAAWGGYLAMLARDGEAARRLTERAVHLATTEGLDDILVVALNAQGSTMIVGARDLAGVGRLEQSRRLATELGMDAAVSDALVNLGSALGEIREYRLASRYLEEAIAFTTERDLDAAHDYVCAWLARVRFEQGRWDGAEQLLEQLAERRASSPISTIVGRTVLGSIRARRGEPPGDALDVAWRLAERTGDLQRLWPVVAARAEAAWLHGGDAESVARDLDGVLAMAIDAEVAWARDELALWRALLQGREPVPADSGSTPFALQRAGQHARAAAAWGQLGCPYEQAWAMADVGTEAELRAALEILQRLGAEPLARRVRRRLRAVGATRVPLGSRSGAAHPSGLTRRQLAVLELVAAGLTDRQIAERLFVSTKTVGHHVSAILATLGVDGRTSAARLAVELGWVAKMGRSPQVLVPPAP